MDKILSSDLSLVQHENQRKNISRRKKIEEDFEDALKKEAAKLEVKMKVGLSTLKVLGTKLRAKMFSDSEELKKLKFSKPYLKRFTRDHQMSYTNRKSNQIKFTENELKDLRKPIDKILLDHGFTQNRVINLDWGYSNQYLA